ncbi:MAG: YbaN family protein [Bacteroidetes bacterium]|nr:YbaN family protein [Bacteroidota bacterium]
MKGRFKKTVLISAGTGCLILGFIGIFVPLLPTTPFILLAAACYVRSSERLYHWLLHNRLFGKYLKQYREGGGIPVGLKIFTIILLWAVMGYSAFSFVTALWIRLLMLAVAIGVSVHILLIRTAGKKLNR